MYEKNEKLKFTFCIANKVGNNAHNIRKFGFHHWIPGFTEYYFFQKALLPIT